MNYRRPGSIGASAYPGRVFKGKRMSGHFGNKRCTTKNLEVVRVDPERNLLFIRGAVPGPKGGFVQIQTARPASRRASDAGQELPGGKRRRGRVRRAPLPRQVGEGPRVLYRTLKDAVVMFAGEPAPGHGQGQEPRGSPGHEQEALPSKGNRPRPRRRRQVAHLAQRWCGLRSQAARLLLSHAGQGAPPRDAHGALGKLQDGRGRDRRLSASFTAPSARIRAQDPRRSRLAAPCGGRARRRTRRWCGSRSATSPV